MKRSFNRIIFVTIAFSLVSCVNSSKASSWLPSFLCSQQANPAPQWAYYWMLLDSDTKPKDICATLWALERDPQYEGIMLIIDGYARDISSYSCIHDMILRIKKKKPVVALITGSAFSGMYLMASAADYIFAHSGTHIGDIGTQVEIQRWSDVHFEHNNYKANAKTYLFKAGAYKSLENPIAPDLTEEEMAELQRYVEAEYRTLVTSIAQNRNLDVDRANEWADGKTFIASEALKHGLIDEIGTRFEAVDKLVELMEKKQNNS